MAKSGSNFFTVLSSLEQTVTASASLRTLHQSICDLSSYCRHTREQFLKNWETNNKIERKKYIYSYIYTHCICGNSLQRRVPEQVFAHAV